MNKAFAKTLKRLRLSDEGRELLLEVGTLICAFLMAGIRFFFDTYPFALAFCASNRRRTPFALVGAVLGTLLLIPSPIPYLIALLAMVGLRLLGSVWLSDDGERELQLGKRARPSFLSGLFTETVSVRVGISALCTLGLCVYRVVLGAYQFYDIFVLIFSVVLSSILTYALCTLFEKSDTGSFSLGVCALLFVLVFAIRGREIFGLDLSIIISYGATLYASKYVSGAKSTALGALLGICHSIPFAPVFAICALVSSFLWDFSYYLSIISALVMSIGYGVFASGYEAIVYLLPELLLASLVMYPLTRFEILPSPRLLRGEERSYDDIVLDARTLELKSTLDSTCHSLDEISKMLLELSSRSKNPDRDFWRDACLEICETHCYQCPKKEICWERDIITTRDNIAHLGDCAFSDELVGSDCVDTRFLHRCPNIDAIIDEINASKRSLERSRLKYDKLEISADDYKMASRLIEALCTKIDEGAQVNASATDKVTRECKRLGLAMHSIQVFGEERPRIIALNIDTESSKCTLDELHGALEGVLGIRLSEPVIEVVNGVNVMKCHSVHRYKIEYASRAIALREDQLTGDSISAFIGADDKQYMLLCDGMGSGKEASVTSGTCAEFLEKILTACSDKELCLNMLNSFIRAKSLECSSSVDLLELDLISGMGTLIKSGAAPSFVKRAENVFRLHSKTAPIGIMRSLDAERIDFNLREGDFVVMISDGLASDERDSKYIVDFLSSIEIVPDGESVPEQASPTRESIPPANATPSPTSAPQDPLLSILNEPPQDKNPPRRIRFSDVPDAIIDLARARSSGVRDDMCVGIARIDTLTN